MESGWVHVSVDDAQRVKMRDGWRELSKKAKGVEHAGFSFAELLPGTNVVGRVGSKHQCAYFLK